MRNPLFNYVNAIAIVNNEIVYGSIKVADISRIGMDVPIQFIPLSGKETWVSGLLIEV